MPWRTQPTSRSDVRDQLLARYDEALANKDVIPFLYPWATVAAGLVFAYLLIPHGASSFLRRLRYVVWTVNTVLSFYGIIYTRTRLSMGYCGGLVCAWAILWTSVLLLNNDVQRDFKRVEGVHWQRADQRPNSKGNNETMKHQWESFPETSLRKRILWVADLFTEFRGIGWNWQLPTLPPFPREVRKELGEEASHDTTIGRDGTKRYDTHENVLRTSLKTFFICYLSLDGLIIIATHDPYFWGLTGHPAPSFLPQIFHENAFLLVAYRNTFTMLAVYAALQFFFALGPLVFVGLLGSTRIGVWGEPWMYPDVWGSFRKVLDFGLIGFWGSWWHQAFRYAFESNASALTSLFGLDGKTTAGRLMKLLLVFSLSGFLHASGSYASFGETRPVSGAFLFFMLQPLGIVAQMQLKSVLRHAGIARRVPKLLQQLFTLGMTYLWLHYTAPLLCDDFARSGIWMIEPLPISPLRGLDLGDQQDGWWCWRGSWFAWHTGRHWWQTGIAL